MSENKITTYLLYAIGEIVLVVVGILIAVKIDDAYQKGIEQEQQIQYYQGIITDLKKDSIHFEWLLSKFKEDVEFYYLVFEDINKNKRVENPLAYERMLYNRSFGPVTQKNHQATIDKINDFKTREILNEYFLRQEMTQQAINEFNTIVVDISRPYFFNNGILNYDSVFHSDIYGFLPKGPLLNKTKIEQYFLEKEMIQLLAIIRISAGHRIVELDLLKEKNRQLITHLNERAK